MQAVYILSCMAIGYLLGNINPAFFFAKRKGYDARVEGSGNAGASNAYILAGKSAFFITAILDIFKAFLACRLCYVLFPTLKCAEQIGGVFCILGHMFPAALHFVIAFVTNYVCFAAPIMSVVFPGLYYLRTRILSAMLVLLIPALPIIWKHLENFRRIRKGTEARFSYLWNKDAELKRLGR